MLGRDFIRINGVLIPTPASYSCNYDNIEEVNQSEAGTDRTIITRLQKKQYTLTFQVTEYWKQRLLSYGLQPTVSFRVGEETTLHGRFRVTGDTLVTNSNLADVALYSVSTKFNQI